MNQKNIEVVKLDIWRNFENLGQFYYLEICHYIDGSIQAFANKRPGKVQTIIEEFPIGNGRDDCDPTIAAIKAFENIEYQ